MLTRRDWKIHTLYLNILMTMLMFFNDITSTLPESEKALKNQIKELRNIDEINTISQSTFSIACNVLIYILLYQYIMTY